MNFRKCDALIAFEQGILIAYFNIMKIPPKKIKSSGWLHFLYIKKKMF